MWNPDLYIKAWNFASQAHQGQCVPGTELPYINHIGTVTMEAMAAIAQSPSIRYPDLLVQCALLHDVIEDTPHTYADVEREFGVDVAKGVLALSKNQQLPSKLEQIQDSLTRIQQQPQEIWMVKLCDRITNLQPPPHYWNSTKIQTYRDEALLIWSTLGEANLYLADRLKHKIAHYGSSS
jgi:(p)ppGpp synthase/HD superfamily hydrolase